jgi:L-seryl-tRNA(Ser) seleniumtransferase
MSKDDLRRLPSIDKLLNSELALQMEALYGRNALVHTLRETLDNTRKSILDGELIPVDEQSILQSAESQLMAAFMPTLRPVINATGVIIHTNLGRALLSEDAQKAVQAVAANYSNLEFNLENGKRGSRYLHAEESLKELTGAEAALVVNNNAAALVLALSTLAHGKTVIISRGQLVEIGGGFRIPDIMVQSGAKLLEVGTSNRTRISDYETAIDDNTAMLLRVHSSNFRVIGFTEETLLEDLAELAHQHNRLLVDDLGSGTLLDTAHYGLLHEPMIQESMIAQVDLILFSGDKLLGGPQAGIMIGKQAIVGVLKKHPLARALRADKLCYAALSTTLDHYRRGEAVAKIPIWRMIAAQVDELEKRVRSWLEQLEFGEIIEGQSAVGGGSLPGTSLPTALLALDPHSAEQFAAELRAAPMPIIARITDNRVLFDPRTVLPEQESLFIDILKKVFTPPVK